MSHAKDGPADPAQLLVTMAVAGRVLNVSERHVRNYVAAKKLPAIRLGRSVRIALDDLRAFVAAHRR